MGWLLLADVLGVDVMEEDELPYCELCWKEISKYQETLKGCIAELREHGNDAYCQLDTGDAGWLAQQALDSLPPELRG